VTEKKKQTTLDAWALFWHAKRVTKKNVTQARIDLEEASARDKKREEDRARQFDADVNRFFLEGLPRGNHIDLWDAVGFSRGVGVKFCFFHYLWLLVFIFMKLCRKCTAVR